MPTMKGGINGSMNKQKTPRTAKACDHCKKKKVKCDGQNPCERCQRNATECIYTHVERPKPITRQRQSKKGAIKNLDTRIEKLEDLLSTLVSKISDRDRRVDYLETNGDGISNEKQFQHVQSSPSSEASKDNSKSTTTVSDVTSSDTDQGDITMEERSPIEGRNAGKERTKYAKPGISQGHCTDGYVGSQCTLSIFSAQGILWLSKKSGDANILKPILNMVREMVTILSAQRETLSLPVTNNELLPLPSQDQCLQLLKVYEKPTLLGAYVIDKQEMKGLLDRYYDILEKGENSIAKKLSSAEMLSLYLMVVLGACYKAEESIGKGNDEDIMNYQKMEHRYFISALYYYQRISIFGEGIPGLKATLLLTCYIELSILPELDYILISTAIRFAQYLGLHRKESLIGLTEEEVTTRKRLWSLCYMLDGDLCLKSGKPPMINDEDMSSIETDEPTLFFQDIKEKTGPHLGLKAHELDFNNLDHCSAIYFVLQNSPTVKNVTITEYSWLELSKITSKAYNQLFSANAFHGKTRSDILEIINSLDKDLLNLKLALPISMRPGHPIKIPPTSSTYETDFNQTIRTQLAYHLVVMVVNRMALRKHWDYDHGSSGDEDGGDHLNHNGHRDHVLEMKFTKLCLESCQEIMNICNFIVKTNFNLWISGSFVLFSSYVISLTYIIENPQESEAKKMLKDMLFNFLDTHFQFYPSERTDLINYIKINGLGFSISIFLKIASGIYNDNNPNDLIADELLEKLDESIYGASKRLTLCMEDYKHQQSMGNHEKKGLVLSNRSVRDIISSPSSRPSLTRKSSSKSLSSQREGNNPYSPAHGIQSLVQQNVDGQEKTLLEITKESLKTNEKRRRSIQHINMANDQFPDQPRKHLESELPSHVTAVQYEQPDNHINATPPSIDEVLDTSELQMDWNIFGHGLFNIPVPFMDDLGPGNIDGNGHFF